MPTTQSPYRGSKAYIGVPQSGKTMRMVHDFLSDIETAVLIEPIWRVEYFRGVPKVTNVTHLQDLLHKGTKKVVWLIDEDEGELLNVWLRAQYDIRKRLLAQNRRPPILVVYVDEVDKFASRYAPITEGVTQAVSKMGNFGVVGCVATQRFAMTSRNVYANCYEWVLFRSFPGDLKALETYHSIPISDEVKSWIQRPYHSARYDTQGTWHLADPQYKEIPAGKAPDTDGETHKGAQDGGNENPGGNTAGSREPTETILGGGEQNEMS